MTLGGPGFVPRAQAAPGASDSPEACGSATATAVGSVPVRAAALPLPAALTHCQWQ